MTIAKRLDSTTGSAADLNLVYVPDPFIFLALTLSGHATMWMAVFADMGVSLLVILNGLRLLHGSKGALRG
ncbi:hypothetical protein [Halopseudomonas bauzanensis]|uniref:hypothetical protein n=1 Tax=Halopseudomonas bauzanensis TaxID=653930 RepID=UPI0025545BA6|nr:hypothetical protein [Halopseudomonas bauzanensis]